MAKWTRVAAVARELLLQEAVQVCLGLGPMTFMAVRSPAVVGNYPNARGGTVGFLAARTIPLADTPSIWIDKRLLDSTASGTRFLPATLSASGTEKA